MAEIIQWEYRVQSIGSMLSNPKDADVQELLNEWGEEGWEVISAIQEENSNKIRLIAKRHLTFSGRRRRSYPEA